jgi:hypothetical protein
MARLARLRPAEQPALRRGCGLCNAARRALKPTDVAGRPTSHVACRN